MSMFAHLKNRLSRTLVFVVLTALTTTGLALVSAVSPPQASAATNICRYGEVACQYRVLKFSHGSRRYDAVTREIRLRPRGSDPLPYCDFYRIRVYSNGSGALTSCETYLHARAGETTPRLFGWHWIFDPGFWTGTVSIAWKITKCVTFVVMALAPITKVYRVIKEAGTIRKVATILVKAGSFKALKEEAPKLAFALSGINGVITNCF